MCPLPAYLQVRCHVIAQTYGSLSQKSKLNESKILRILSQMTQSSITQRLKILIERLGLNTRSFSQALGVSEGTTRNYFNRASKPNADYLEKIGSSFESANLHWLITGTGEPLLSNSDVQTSNTAHIENNSGIGINNGTATITLEACQRELAACQKDCEHLKAQLASAEALVASKNETIMLLRGSYRNPN